MAVRFRLALAPLLTLIGLVACAAPQDGEADDPGSSEDAIVATVTPGERTAVADQEF